MGKFVAFKDEDDTRDDELDTLSNVKYYRTILSRTFDAKFFTLSENADSVNIGTIKLDPALLPNQEAVRKRIAETEAKYFFKWHHDDDKEVSTDDGPVLNRLRRVDVFRYWNTKRGSTNGFFDELVLKQIQNQDSSISSLAKAIEYEPLIFDGSEAGTLKAVVQPRALALYTDTVERTAGYKFKYTGAAYEAVKTWKSHPSELARGDDPYRAEGYSKTDRELRYRYLLSVFSNLEFPKPKRKKSVVPSDELFCTDDPRWRAWFKTIPAETQTRIKQAATDGAKQMPDGYDCYYYDFKGAIDGFVAEVNIGEGVSGAGSGGYTGRADKVNEIDYRWEIVPVPDTADFYLARVLSILIGLDTAKHLPTDPTFYTTNYPYHRMSPDPNVPATVPILFRYSKKFLPDAARKNEPKKDLRAPRLYPPRQYPKPPKDPNEDKGLRKWRKGPTLSGEPLGSGTKKQRNAGGDMAKALRKFEFFKKAADANSKITLSTLPATAFARYVVTTDRDVILQWKSDNGLANNPVEGDVRTEQEWCHLYGNGDGGRETPDNFVSGSEHCNTEQLAIETGQRRVSQNTDIDEAIRKKLAWRITATEFPNQGSPVAVFDTELAKTKLETLNDTWRDTVKTYFFDDKNGTLTLKADDIVRNGLKLLAANISQVKNIYRAAVNAKKPDTEIEEAKRVVVNFVNFQRDFLEQFYTYYPLGRFVRYRIFYDGKKCFEHQFDAQSESFDLNEAKILDYTVEHAIYSAIEKAGDQLRLVVGNKSTNVSALEFYENVLAGRLEKYLLTPEENKIIKEITDAGDAIIAIQDKIDKKIGDVDKLTGEKRKRAGELEHLFETNRDLVRTSKKLKQVEMDVSKGITPPVVNELKRRLNDSEKITKFDQEFKKRKTG
jgi:hypothetical protein